MISSYLTAIWNRYLMLVGNHCKSTLAVAIILISIAAIFIRSIFLGSISYDMGECLVPWFNAIKQNGGLQALSEQTGVS